MNRLIKEGVIFSIVIIVIFAVISLVLPMIIIILDYSTFGFPLPISAGWGPCPPGAVCHAEYPLNLLLNLIIAIVIGFGTAFVKKTVMK